MKGDECFCGYQQAFLFDCKFVENATTTLVLFVCYFADATGAYQPSEHLVYTMGSQCPSLQQLQNWGNQASIPSQPLHQGTLDYNDSCNCRYADENASTRDYF